MARGHRCRISGTDERIRDRANLSNPDHFYYGHTNPFHPPRSGMRDGRFIFSSSRLSACAFLFEIAHFFTRSAVPFTGPVVDCKYFPRCNRKFNR